MHEASFEQQGEYTNPYAQLEAVAVVQTPAGEQRRSPLCWDGGDRWLLRLCPDTVGSWSYTVESTDRGLNGRTGRFECVSSSRRGSIKGMQDFPHHFQYQNGEPVWFLGDTAWALFTDNAEEQHDRRAVAKYLEQRASQGFNVVHGMLLSEAGWGNAGGPPFTDLSSEQINPAYWQEVDHRVAEANRQGITVGLVVAWGDKAGQEPFAWRRFPDLAARQRYARYVASRYGAYDVYFLVSGEWHGEVHTRPSTEAEMKQEFIAIGDALDAAETHGRMIGIHPMTHHGSVREFNDAKWMSFGDYQQNYTDLHERMLQSRGFHKPLVNSEYAYHLRDQDGNGVPDKENSTSLESMRHATWDIVMAGGYVVTGFGTTYFGGYRDPGPFDVDAARNDGWEQQVGVPKDLLTALPWWKLTPHDDWISADIARGADREHLDRVAPPAATYWMLAEPGHHYLAYARGVSRPVSVQLGPDAGGRYEAHLYNLRTGAMVPLGQAHQLQAEFRWTPPDAQDWVLHLERRQDG